MGVSAAVAAIRKIKFPRPAVRTGLKLAVISLCLRPASVAAAESAPPSPINHCDTLELEPGDSLIILGSRFLVPGSLRLSCNNEAVPDSLFTLEKVPGVVRLRSSLSCPRVIASYRAWSFLAIPDSFRLRLSFPDTTAAAPGPADTLQAKHSAVQAGTLSPATIGEGFRLVGFDIQGSKSVSVSGGGATGGTLFDQNLILGIDGKLTPDTRLSFRLNDQDLPLATVARSTELRQLDEISVTLSSPHAAVSLGDYDFKLAGFEYATVERKLDGVSGSLTGGPVSLGASAALSGGTFQSLRFNGTEGRQGPYQLTGKSGEPVRVLAGTERVYLDGKALKRGVHDDYVLDYNQGTLFFTDSRLIGAESRIEVDYEYSGFSFKKALYSVTAESANRLGKLRGYFIRESDLEDSPLGGQFTPAEQQYLDQLGGGLDTLLLSGVRFLGEGRGSYRMRFDGPANPYFEYVGQGNGDYQVSFREAGTLRGSYTFDPSTGAYRYVGPSLGDFEPAGEVSPPRREDRTGLAFELSPHSHLRLEGEGALLKRTLNLFSGSADPLRTAHKLYVHLDTLALGKAPARLSIWGGESTVDRGFSFLGRRYEADFERRWHLTPLAPGEKEAEHGEKLRETGTTVALPLGLQLGTGYGRLERSGGENSERRTYSLDFAPQSRFSAAWSRINIHAERLPPDSSGGGAPVASHRYRDNAEARARLGIFTPYFTLEREEQTAPDLLGGGLDGNRHLEISQRLAAAFSPRFQTEISVSGRNTQGLSNGAQAGAPLDWEPQSSFRTGQVDLRYQGRGALRIKGRLGHRSQRYRQSGLGRTSSTAGRIEVFGGGFHGALQSNVIYEVSHGSSLLNRVVYLPERYPDDGEYLQDGTYVGKEQGTHRREIIPAEIDPRQSATLNLTARENLDLTAWVDSSRKNIQSMNLSTTLQLKRESTLRDSWRLYCLLPSALNDRENALLQSTLINSDLAIQWTDPAVFSRIELVWNTRLDRRFQNGFEQFGDKALRFQLRAPLSRNLEWDPTAVVSRRLRDDLSGGSRSVRSYTLDNSLIYNLSNEWRATLHLEAARFRVAGRDSRYSRISPGAGVTRFLGRSGRLEAGLDVNRLWGPRGEDILLVDVLGSARPGTSLQATAAVSVEPGERLLLHVRYTGRTDYLLNRFTHYGRAELKYFF